MNRQLQHDIAEVADSYSAGGARLSSRVFSAVVAARGLKEFEAVILRDKVRKEIGHRFDVTKGLV